MELWLLFLAPARDSSGWTLHIRLPKDMGQIYFPTTLEASLKFVHLRRRRCRSLISMHSLQIPIATVTPSTTYFDYMPSNRVPTYPATLTLPFDIGLPNNFGPHIITMSMCSSFFSELRRRGLFAHLSSRHHSLTETAFRLRSVR